MLRILVFPRAGADVMPQVSTPDGVKFGGVDERAVCSCSAHTSIDIRFDALLSAHTFGTPDFFGLHITSKSFLKSCSNARGSPTYEVISPWQASLAVLRGVFISHGGPCSTRLYSSPQARLKSANGPVRTGVTD